MNSRRQGQGDEQILATVVNLTPEDLEAIWNYYTSHQAEIDEDIRDNEGD